MTFGLSVNNVLFVNRFASWIDRFFLVEYISLFLGGCVLKTGEYVDINIAFNGSIYGSMDEGRFHF